MIAAAWIVAAFLIGSIPFGLIIGRVFFHTDIRTSGSGNIGTVNALRSLGKAAGASVLILDVAKGLVPTAIALAYGPHWLAALTGAATIAGHCFSPWLGWRGGKGVATALGAIIALSPPAALAFVIVWVIVVAATRYASLGSMLGTLASFVVLALAAHDPTLTAFGALTFLFIVYTHRENIGRLRAGKENALRL